MNPADARQTLRDARRLTVGVLLVVLGLFLIGDATTYSLYPADPSTGRPSACFTKVDLWLGLGPSEGGILTGTRLAELVIGMPLLVLATGYSLRKFWRSRVELPLLAVAMVVLLWQLGKASFWSFHDADMYLTWRIIGNTPNVVAERIIAGAVLVVGSGACAVAYRMRRGRYVTWRTVLYLWMLSTALCVTLFRSLTVAHVGHILAATLLVSLLPLAVLLPRRAGAAQ